MPSSPERTGVIVIRVWLEATCEEGTGLRARITAVPDLTDPEVETAVASTLEEILEAVDHFVSAFRPLAH